MSGTHDRGQVAHDEVVPAALEGERVDRVVALLTGLARAEVSALVEAGGVRLRGRPVRSRAVRVSAGERLEVAAPGPVAVPVETGPLAELEVVHVDADVLVIDKQAGLVVHPGAGNRTGTLAQAVVARFPEVATVGEPERPGIVHRLDSGTSGLLVVARTPASYDSLVGQLSARTVERRYLALVKGHPEPPTGRVEAPIGRSRREPTRMAVTPRGREASTHYETEGRYAEPVPVALLRCRLETGRTHQVRVHLSAIGHPVVGDRQYGGAVEVIGLGRPFLHAARLAFASPSSGDQLAFESPLPADLRGVLDGLTPAL